MNMSSVIVGAIAWSNIADFGSLCNGFPRKLAEFVNEPVVSTNWSNHRLQMIGVIKGASPHAIASQKGWL